MKSIKTILVRLVVMSLILTSLNILPLFALAQSDNYQLLEPSVIIDSPNKDSSGNATQPSNYSFKDYLQTAYVALFVVVITAIVFFFVIGGLEYVISDIPMAKLGGKDKIKKALLGLLIALCSVLLLRLINPDLLNFNLTLT